MLTDNSQTESFGPFRSALEDTPLGPYKTPLDIVRPPGFRNWISESDPISLELIREIEKERNQKLDLDIVNALGITDFSN